MSGVALQSAPELAPPAENNFSSPSSPSRLRLSVPSISHVQLGAEEVEALIREHAPNGQYAAPLTLIDVRGSDWEGGRVRGSIHVPFEELEVAMPTVLQQAQQARTQKIVFICMFGVQQSPAAAEMFLARWREAHGGDAESAADDESAPMVAVLSGGLSGLLNRHVEHAADKTVTLRSNSNKLIESFDPAKWVSVAVPRTPTAAARGGPDQEYTSGTAQQVVYRDLQESSQLFVNAANKEAQHAR